MATVTVNTLTTAAAVITALDNYEAAEDATWDIAEHDTDALNAAHAEVDRTWEVYVAARRAHREAEAADPAIVYPGQ